MTATTIDVHGPVDFVLLEFPRDGLTGEAAQALVDLVERGIVRIYDLMVISKDLDGGLEVLQLTDPGSSTEGFAYFAGARSGLLGDEDMREAAAAMDRLPAGDVMAAVEAMEEVGTVAGGEVPR